MIVSELSASQEPVMDEQNSFSDGNFLLRFYRNQRRAGALLIVVPLLVLIVVMVIGTMNSSQGQLHYERIGIHLMLDDGRNRWETELWETHLMVAAQVSAPGGIAVQLVRVDDLDTERWQAFLSLALRFDLQPVLRLATRFDTSQHWWQAPQPDADGSYTSWGEQYAAFLNALDWGERPPWVILLNEPNNGHEWGGRPDPAAYARFVADVSDVLRAQVPRITILNAALDLYAPHTGSQPFPESALYHVDANSYLDALYAADATFFTHFDYWNSHAYTPDFSAAPYVQEYRFDMLHDAVDRAVPPPPGIYNRGVNGYAWELWKLEQLGVDTLPVVISEAGWRHSQNGSYPDARTAAQYLDIAMRGRASIYVNQPLEFTPWLLDERVAAVALFTLNGMPSEWDTSNLLQLDERGQVLGTYAMFDLLKGYPLRNQ
jgi:hypothetical protein